MKHQWKAIELHALNGSGRILLSVSALDRIECEVCRVQHLYRREDEPVPKNIVISECPGPTKEKPRLPEKFETLGPLQYFSDGSPPRAPESVPTMKAVRDTINDIIDYLKAREEK